MVQITNHNHDWHARGGFRQYDLSFMYSKECDLECTFCMYSSSPRIRDRLDLDKLQSWLKTLRYEYINAIGIYGGEPWLFMAENGWILDHVSGTVPRFIITNGTWSKNIVDTTKFLTWVEKHELQVFVSGTDQHIPFQDRSVLELLARKHKNIHLKPADTQILPMGNLLGKGPVRCTCKCLNTKRPTRLAVQPDGTIIYQTCDGVYPTIGSLDDPWDTINTRVSYMLHHEDGFKSICLYYEEAWQRKNSHSKER